MKLVLLCGGSGTWIRDVSVKIFKHILPINDPIPLPLLVLGTTAKPSLTKERMLIFCQI